MMSEPERFLGNFTEVQRRIVNEMELHLIGKLLFVEVTKDGFNHGLG